MPDSSQPPRMLKSPLVLKAMTLRGRGPYLHGARLDIRPLTILCGENGSGKSIWTELLRDMWWALICSHDDGFPWWGLVRTPDMKADVDVIDRKSLHSAIVTAEFRFQSDAASIREAREQLFQHHSDDDETFGPPGTIGFEILAADDFEIEKERRATTTSLPGDGTTRTEQFLRTARMHGGDSVRIRWCQLRQDFWKTQDAGTFTNPAGLTELLELTLNGRDVIRLQHRHGMGDGEDSGELPEDDLYFTLECSPSFWGETNKDASVPVILGMVEVTGEQERRVLIADHCPIPESALRNVCNMLDDVVNHILKQVIFSHFFPIGPIRVTHQLQKTTTARVTWFDGFNREILRRRSELSSYLLSETLRSTLKKRSGFSDLSETLMPQDIPLESAQPNPEEETDEQFDQRLSQEQERLLREFVVEMQTEFAAELDALATRSDPDQLIDKYFTKVPLKRRGSKAHATVAAESDKSRLELQAVQKDGVTIQTTSTKMSESLKFEPDDDSMVFDWFEQKDERGFNGTFRYVGEDGRNAQELWARYAYCLMREPSAPFVGSINNLFVENDFDTDAANGVVDAIKNLPEDVLRRVLDVCDTELREEWNTAVNERTTDNTFALRLLNHALLRRELFDPADWSSVTGEAAMLLGSEGKNLPSLTEGEIIRLNRLLLEEAFARDGQRRCHHRTGYLFETYFSYWMEQLTGTLTSYGLFEGPVLSMMWKDSDSSSTAAHPPAGGLTEDKGANSKWMPRGTDFRQTEREVEPGSDDEDLKHVILPTTSSVSTDWATMSTGFHQLAPIVLQAGLLQQNELMSIQNPEAHLHPKLQIEVAEFLIHQALAGKNIIVETHSDLFVRRILRAIREEDIKQEAVRIYFTHLENGPDDADWKHAVMEHLQINDQGQIANWPPGFMTDSLDEARRFIDDEMDDLSDEGTSDE